MLKLFNKDGVEVLPDEMVKDYHNLSWRFVNIVSENTINVHNGRFMFADGVGAYPGLHIVDVPTTGEPFSFMKEALKDADPNWIKSFDDLPKVDERILYNTHTKLSEALLKFFDAGYTAHRHFDQDRATVRSVHFKRKDKTTLVAHVELIDGNRYIRNSIFNMLS